MKIKTFKMTVEVTSWLAPWEKEEAIDFIKDNLDYDEIDVKITNVEEIEAEYEN